MGRNKQREVHLYPSYVGICGQASRSSRSAIAPRGSLGFDFYWGKSRHNPNYWRLRRVTNAKKFRYGLKALKDWLKKSRSLPLPEIVATLKSKLRGTWNYYGVIGNSERNGRYAWFAQRLVYKWLNRRSQRRSYNMTAFTTAWARWDIPMPCVVEKPWPQLDKPKWARYECVNQQVANHDRSSTCAHT